MKSFIVEKLNVSDFFTVVVIGTRGHDDHKANIATLFTKRNDQLAFICNVDNAENTVFSLGTILHCNVQVLLKTTF